MGVWDTATPAGSDPISAGDDRIRELKTAIQESLRGGTTDGLEAVFPGAAPTTAPVFHYRGLKGSTGSRPAATEAGLYFNTTTGTLQRADGSVWLDLTENAAYEAIHQAVAGSLASSSGVITLDETTNCFNVTGTEAVTQIAGWSAGIVYIKWTSARTLTHSSGLALLGAVDHPVAANDVSVFLFSASNTCREILFYGAPVMPTRQVFTSGSGTYTTPARCKQIKVRMLGGGGGGGSAESGGNDGVAGGDTSFNSIVAAGGSGGGGTIAGPLGAHGTGGAGSASVRIAGGGGREASVNPFANADGAAGPANSGRGGGGGQYVTGGNAGFPGGGGEYVEYYISSPGASYSYAVGAGGAGGAAGSQAGGAGGSGIVIVEELY